MMRKLLTSAAAAIVVAGTLSAPASADPDPHIPIPPRWCMGGGNGFRWWGGYCEGIDYPDGTRLNVHWVLGGWSAPECIIPNGTPALQHAPPGGCDGFG